MLDFNDTFAGCDTLTTGDYLTFKHVADSARQHDKSLYESKWFDYRFMSPIEATAEFIAAYERVGRRIYARDIDMERAEHIRFLSAQEYMERLEGQTELMASAKTPGQKKSVEKSINTAKRNFAGHWRARSVADAIGMPYDDFIDCMMTSRMAWEASVVWRDKMGNAKARRPALAQPTQLYNESDVNKTIQRWAELQTSRIYYAKHHAYMPENWRGTPAQMDYTRYLIDRAAGRHHVLVQMVEEDRLSVQGMRAVLGDAECERLMTFRSQ